MDSKLNGVDMMADWARAPPPPTGPLWARVAKVLYDPEEKSFLGRTPRRWATVLAFYFVFYVVLGIMFSLCMGGLYLSLEPHRPTRLLDDSLIGANPGVAYRPRAHDDGFLVRYSADNSSHTETYVDQMRDFMQAYVNESWYTSKTECSAEDNFGFPETPCFFIKLNKILEWTPEFYDAAHPPADMPEDLVKHIMSLDPQERQQVWITCEEEHEENSTKIEFPWGRGLPARFYPFTNEPGYRSPLLAVRLSPLPNHLVTVRCRAWAKNVRYDKSQKEPSGYTRIQLYIEGSFSHAADNTTHTE